MNLHNNKELFEQIITAAAEDFRPISASIVEKDYYVTQFLKKLTGVQPDLIFKGGTSLSKGYKIIKRFSEDIDVSLRSSEMRPSREQKNRLNENIGLLTKELGLELLNPIKNLDEQEFTNYIIKYTPIFPTPILNPHILVEASFFMKSFPEEILQISSLVHDFMLANDGHTEIEANSLQPFKVPIQSLIRTFVDKVFAVLDYYLENKLPGNYQNKLLGKSRHIYDLYKIYPEITMNSEAAKLPDEIFKLRKLYVNGLSTKGVVKFHKELQTIIDDNIYRYDYDNVTKKLLYENVPYSEAITVLTKIIEDGYFDFPK